MFWFKRKKIKANILEVDEVLFDHYQLNYQSNIKWENRLEKKIDSKNLRIFGYFLFSLLFLVFLRYFYIAVLSPEDYALKAQANYVKEVWSLGPRGIVYDTNLKPLVKNTSSFNLVVIPAELPRDRNEQKKILYILASLLNQSPDDISAEFENIDRFSFKPVLVLEDLTHEELLTFKTKLNDLTGFSLEENFKREYESHGIFSHVLGYTGRVSVKDIKNNPDYLLTDIIGKNGLEAEYETDLKGQHGLTKLETYASGGKGRVVGTSESKPGHNLVLFLDAGLQAKLTESMARILGGIGLSRGAAVAIDPKSGAILAMQSFPLFDGNMFTQRLDEKKYKDVFENSNQPLFNRAISGMYPPGSTIKPFIGVGALQEKVVDDKTTINDKGSISVGSQIFKGWTTLGIVDIYRAIAMSSNIFFYTVGGGYGNITGLGPAKVADYFKRFGFSKTTNIDLPGESSGFVPTPEWKRKAKGEGWFVGDTYNMSIGQGFVQVTPLQLALATSAIANNGTLLKPRVVKSITNSKGEVIKNIEPEILSKNFVDTDALAIIRKAMRETVLSGSGKALAELPGSAGAKTGTAQTGIGNNTHAWFTVFAPYDDPKIVLTVLIENGGEGSSVAVPVAKEVLEWYLAR